MNPRSAQHRVLSDHPALESEMPVKPVLANRSHQSAFFFNSLPFPRSLDDRHKPSRPSRGFPLRG